MDDFRLKVFIAAARADGGATTPCEWWLAPRMATNIGQQPSSHDSERLSVTTDRTSASQPVNFPPTTAAISESL